MAAAIAWLGDSSGHGCWGSPADLAIPLDDRGLLLADGLFETVLVEAGRGISHITTKLNLEENFLFMHKGSHK